MKSIIWWQIFWIIRISFAYLTYILTVHEISVVMHCNKKLDSRKKIIQACLKFYWEKYTAFLNLREQKDKTSWLYIMTLWTITISIENPLVSHCLFELLLLKFVQTVASYSATCRDLLGNNTENKMHLVVCYSKFYHSNFQTDY